MIIILAEHQKTKKQIVENEDLDNYLDRDHLDDDLDSQQRKGHRIVVLIGQLTVSTINDVSEEITLRYGISIKWDNKFKKK